MPRLQPPPGLMTARDAATRLGVSDALLSRYVNEGKLRRYGPPERKHKFYKISEVEALLQSERVFVEYHPGDYRKHPSSTFELATEQDLPAIVEISERIFSDPPPLETRRAWMRKNPETFHILRDQDGIIKGFSSMLPLREDVLFRFVNDEIEIEQITANDVETFDPKNPIHFYVMALAIDPSCTMTEKHTYGSRLVAGLFSFLLDLAQRGIEIASITARTYKPDGLRLLRHMNIPQLRSPVPGKNLFSVRVAESGIPLLVRYSELLDQWKSEHGTVKPRRARTRKQNEAPTPAAQVQPDLWGNGPPS